MRVQMNVLVEPDLKEKAQTMIKRYKHLDGQPVSLSDLIERCLKWYIEADEGEGK
jgi:hypothetical protein